MENRQKIKGYLHTFFTCILFGFLFSVSAMLMYKRASIVLGTEKTTLIYAINFVALSFGFAGFGLLFYTIKSSRRKEILLGVAIISYLVSLAGVLCSTGGMLFLVATVCLPFSYGFFGGITYYLVAKSLDASKHMGKVIGFSYAAEVLVQYWVQKSVKSEMTIGMLLLFLSLLWLWQISHFAAWDAEEETNVVVENDRNEMRRLLLTGGIIFLLAFMAGIYDGMSVSLVVTGKLNVGGWTRLLLMVGAATAAFLIDAEKEICLNILVLASSLLNTICILLLSTGENYLVSHLLYSLSMGAYVIYMMVSFMKLARQTVYPAVWAGMGRVFHSMAMALATMFSYYFRTMSFIQLNAITIFIYFLTLIFFVWSGKFSTSKKEVTEQQTDVEVDYISLFAEQYQLSDSEQKIFHTLITTELGTQEIAEMLYISRRSLQRVIASIYQKTNTKTRVGLYQCYQKMKEKHL